MKMVLTHDQETIIAQCTPQGPGALAIIRLSGVDALTIAQKISILAHNNISLHQVPTHTIHYGSVCDKKKHPIDQVLFMVMHAPRTFTGQDTVEITCHNNQFIIQAIIEQAINHGARLAQHGEFSKRAVLNNKIDLLQAEAIHELILANTQTALKKSLAQLHGSFSQWISSLEQELLKALAFSEASFEFIDEEMTFDNQIKTILNAILDTIANIKKTFDKQQLIRQGIRIAILGSTNAGKSSLFNALLNKNRAIVTNIPGTTRDTLEAGIYRNGIYWTLIDTAGLRQTNDTIEQEGIKKSYQEAQLADIILLVFDGTRIMTIHEKDIYTNLMNQFKCKIILVRNKVDMPILSQFCKSQPDILDISSSTKMHIDLLEQKIDQCIKELFKQAEAPFLVNERQYNLLIHLEQKLKAILPLLDKNIQYEIVSYNLQDALAHISELTGKTISEQGMDRVFREFCIGK
jgi:tRNA modification GTPase